MNDSQFQQINVGAAEAAPVVADARAGLPSASHMERIMLCPGSWRAQQGLADEPREDAVVGRRVHQWLAGVRLGLSDEEQAMADACRGQQERLSRRLWGEDGAGGGTVEYAERRFWLHDDGLAAAMSGQVDYAAVRGRRALIVDFKTGHGRVTPGVRNPQLMALAVMLAEAHADLEEITGAIVQPAVSPTPRCGVFDAPALAQSRALILEALETARRPDAPCQPGERQCQYCRAKARCAAAERMVETLALVPTQGLAAAAHEAPAEPVTNERLAGWLDRCGAAEDVIAALRAEARRRIEAGQRVPGWRLVPGVLRERVVNVPGLVSRLAAQGVSQEAFLATCAVTKIALKALLKEKTGTKGMALEAALDAVLDGLTEAKPTAPQLAWA